ncbi:putative IQ motif, EF-hand binding protein [Helianthus anomalus]
MPLKDSTETKYSLSLARKALYALRGLVKLQALVRGHLVRKRTTAMVRCMSALVAIQVRARFQRIQMVENTGSTSKQGFVMGHERRLNAPQLVCPLLCRNII